MAKLTKQEVNALAAKAYREIIKKLEDKRKDLFKNYTPSATYTKMHDLLEKIMYRNIQMKVLIDETNELKDSFREIYRKEFGINRWINLDVSKNSEIDNILNDVKNLELDIEDEPTFESLKDEIVIASMGDDSDANTLIEKIVSKFI